MLKVERFSSITQIDETLWNSLVAPIEIFNSHKFVRTIESANVENAAYRYLLFYDGDVLVGHTVLSYFTISLDLFIPNNSVANFIKKLWPNFFHVKILFSGLPASLAQLNLAVKANWQIPVNEALSKEMHSFAYDQNISLLCVKEFKNKEANGCAGLINAGFFKAFSLPYMILGISWESFEEFMAQMRHPYRRAVRQSLQILNTTEPVIHNLDSVDKNSTVPVLVLGDGKTCPPEIMYELYLSVMERAPSKLETLNLAFFRNLYQNFADDLQVLTLQYQGMVVCAALLIRSSDELTFILVGRKNDKDQLDSYFNLVYGIIQIGIQQRVKRINMGQTAYWVKQRVGARPIPMYIYLKSRKPIVNFLLTKLNKVIFPELTLKPAHVFKAPHLTGSLVTPNKNVLA